MVLSVCRLHKLGYLVECFRTAIADIVECLIALVRLSHAFLMRRQLALACFSIVFRIVVCI